MLARRHDDRGPVRVMIIAAVWALAGCYAGADNSGTAVTQSIQVLELS